MNRSTHIQSQGLRPAPHSRADDPHSSRRPKQASAQAHKYRQRPRARQQYGVATGSNDAQHCHETSKKKRRVSSRPGTMRNLKDRSKSCTPLTQTERAAQVTASSLRSEPTGLRGKICSGVRNPKLFITILASMFVYGGSSLALGAGALGTMTSALGFAACPPLLVGTCLIGAGIMGALTGLDHALAGRPLLPETKNHWTEVLGQSYFLRPLYR
ncbi:MAG: hypothetical protein OXC07_09780 [Kistimonas sp.]|nr:hypothetical protein [Kistimonas sp.]